MRCRERGDSEEEIKKMMDTMEFCVREKSRDRIDAALTQMFKVFLEFYDSEPEERKRFHALYEISDDLEGLLHTIHNITEFVDNLTEADQNAETAPGSSD